MTDTNHAPSAPMTPHEFCAEADRIGLTADTLAQQLAARPEFADCLPTEQTPTFYASPEQANALRDRPEDSEGGVYLPLRKTSAGKFTMPLYAATIESAPPAAVGLTRDAIQQRALEHGFEYWRASDSHGVEGTKPQAVELLQDLLGVEVEIKDNGCTTCNGAGMIGGPSFYNPGEGGEPCPDCASREPFQQRVAPWLLACFGEEIAGDREERNHRFLEEALELVQACGCTAGEAHQLADYVFGRDVGEKAQEVGGVMVTLAALCLAQGLDMAAAGDTELARIWTKVEQIRAKQAAKPKHSPLPEAPTAPDDAPLETGEGDAR